MGNKWKGTFEVQVCGESYTLRPSFDALCEFHEATGVSPQAARQQLLEGDFGPKIIPAAIWAGILGEYLINGGKKIESVRVMGEMMRKEGVFKYQVDALKLLTYAMSADEIIESIEAEQEDDEKKS